MAKRIIYNENARRALEKGIDILCEAVAVTLGPKGRNVVIEKSFGAPRITKDGVTVSRFVKLEDPFMDAAAQVIRQASENTNISAGDGTTTATVLSRAILKNAHKHLINDTSVVEIKRGIDKAAAEIAKQLEEMATPVQSKEDIEHIATISANNDAAVGTLISNAVDSVGKDGSITIEEAGSLETSLDFQEGFRFPGGYAAGAFITDERRGAAIYENAFVLVADAKIENVQDILPVLEQVARENKPLVIVASEIEGQALAALIMNAIRRKEMNSGIKVAAIKAPRYGEDRANIMKDMALATGATFITQMSGIAPTEVVMQMLGSAQTIEIGKSHSIIVGGTGDPAEIDERITSLKSELSQTDDLYSCGVIQERITRLASGVAITLDLPNGA